MMLLSRIAHVDSSGYRLVCTSTLLRTVCLTHAVVGSLAGTLWHPTGPAGTAFAEQGP